MHVFAAIAAFVLLFQQVPMGGKKPAPPPPKLAMKLLAAADSVSPGGEVEIAVDFEINKPWHMYHAIRVDTGSPTALKFTVPAGVSIADLRYPTPSLESLGTIEYLELKGRFQVLATLKVEPGVAAGTAITVRADATGLACVEACVPVRASAKLTLAVATEPGKPANEALFKDAREKLPPALDGAPYITGSTIAITKEKLAPGEQAEIVAKIKVKKDHHIQDRDPGVEGLIPSRFFIEPIDGIEIAKTKDQTWPEPHTRNMPGLGSVRELGGEFEVKIPIKLTDEKFASGPVALRILFQYQCCTDAGQCFPPEMAEAVIRFTAETAVPDDGKRAVYVASAEFLDEAGESGADAAEKPAGAAGLTLPIALLLGLLGGLILNVMPCVLPVISIKVMGLVQQGGEDPGRVLRLGLTFCAGIMVWFWLFALLSLTGDLPLQYPPVVIGVSAVLFIMALNLFGVFELTLPGAAAGKLDQATQKEGYPGAFMKGFLATLLGTACTAPFLAQALIFAAAQPFFVSFLVFTAAGLGMALPYLLLCINPKWLRFVPRPGSWMVTFKQSMGFVLLGTVVWLLYVLNTQWGGPGVVWTTCFLGFLGLAVWMIGKIKPSSSARAALDDLGSAAGVTLVGYLFSFHLMYEPEEKAGKGLDVDAVLRLVEEKGWEKGIPWAPYSPGLAEALAERGYTVYVDFTASWCANCKWNLHTVLETAQIRGQMRELGVIPIEADFSKKDPDMLKVIKGFGHPSVPLNLIYPAGRPSQPLVLDVLLSQAHVSTNLDKAGPSSPKAGLARRPAEAQPTAAN